MCSCRPCLSCTPCLKTIMYCFNPIHTHQLPHWLMTLDILLPKSWSCHLYLQGTSSSPFVKPSRIAPLPISQSNSSSPASKSSRPMLAASSYTRFWLLASVACILFYILIAISVAVGLSLAAAMWTAAVVRLKPTARANSRTSQHSTHGSVELRPTAVASSRTLRHSAQASKCQTGTSLMLLLQLCNIPTVTVQMRHSTHASKCQIGTSLMLLLEKFATFS